MNNQDWSGHYSHKTHSALCSHFTSAEQCGQAIMEHRDWNKCRWYFGPRIASGGNNVYCKYYTALTIKVYTVKLMECDNLCSRHPECASFFYGRISGGYYRKCYLQRADPHAPSGKPCYYTSSGNYDVFWPTTGVSAIVTAGNKCTHVSIFSKSSSKIN